MMHSKEDKIPFLGLIIWAIAALFFLYEFFLRTFLGAMAKQIIPDLSLTPSQFALLASFFYIAYGVMQIPVGLLGDRFGVKKCMLFASLLCAFSALGFTLSHSFLSALIFRFLMGVGGGFAFLILLMVTLAWFPKSRLAFFVGLGQFIGTLGALLAAGPLATLITSLSVSWRVVFLWIAFFGFILFLLSLFFVKSKNSEEKDYLIFIKKKLPLKQKLALIFTSRQSYYVAMYSAFIFLSVAMLGAVWGTLYLQSLGLSQKMAAFVVSFGWLGFGVGCPLLGYISDRLVKRKPILVLCALVGLLLICLLVYIKLHSFLIYSLVFFLLGMTSSGQSLGFAMITEHVMPEIKSIALGLNSAFITLLAALTPIIVGSIIQAVVKDTGTSAQYIPSDFTLAFSIMPLLYALALILSLFFIEETFCRSKKEMIYVHL